MPAITGRTRIWAILADPVAQVMAPEKLNQLMALRGIDGVMVPLHVASADLPSVVHGLRRMHNLDGFIATVPHKPALTALCDHLTDRARAIGAVNAVRRKANGELVGDMLDGEGFIRGLREAGIEARGIKAYVVGGGGAAMAVGFALAQEGVRQLTLANRTVSKSRQIHAKLAAMFPEVVLTIGTRDPSGHDLVVNATSLGLHPDDALPLETGKLTPDQIVADIIMQPEVTRLLASAASQGCRTHPGFPMLAFQLEAMADFMGMR